MGKTVELKGGDLTFCRKAFEHFYRQNPPPDPPEMTSREYAFATFGGEGQGQAPFIRHRAMNTREELLSAINALVPRHIYYSTAIYRTPDHPSMKDKGWEGADLTFDLDADHLREAETLSYPKQLELAKERFIYLLDEYILGDFGLRESDVSIAFSGGRGYHAHVHEKGFQALTGGERRELVDYILGVGFDPVKDSFARAVVPGTEGGRGVGPQHLRLYPPSESGWRGRMSRGIQKWLRDRAGLDEEHLAIEVTKLLSEHAGGDEKKVNAPSAKEGAALRPSRQAKMIAKDLARPETQRAILEHQALDNFPHDRTGKNHTAFLEAIARALAVPLQGEMDAPVTTDIHRLIRMPGSLHGGTGFKACVLTRRELDSFDPFRDAAMPDETFSGKQAAPKVVLLQDIDYPFPDVPLKGREGETIDPSTPQTVFLLLRGEATVGSGR
jgi:DNA primase small subunit